jgi:hypothetical protein
MKKVRQNRKLFASRAGNTMTLRNLTASAAFRPWTDPGSGITSYPLHDRVAPLQQCLVMAMLSRRSPPMLSEHLPDLKYSAGLIGPVAPRRAMSVV